MQYLMLYNQFSFWVIFHTRIFINSPIQRRTTCNFQFAFICTYQVIWKWNLLHNKTTLKILLPFCLSKRKKKINKQKSILVKIHGTEIASSSIRKIHLSNTLICFRPQKITYLIISGNFLIYAPNIFLGFKHRFFKSVWTT